jgi:hypothetical protein
MHSNLQVLEAIEHQKIRRIEPNANVLPRAEALGVLFVGTERIALASVMCLVAVLLIITLELFVPRSTGLQSDTAMFLQLCRYGYRMQRDAAGDCILSLREAARIHGRIFSRKREHSLRQRQVAPAQEADVARGPQTRFETIVFRRPTRGRAVRSLSPAELVLRSLVPRSDCALSSWRRLSTVTLSDARARAADARRLLIDDVDSIENQWQQRAQTSFTRAADDARAMRCAA